MTRSLISKRLKKCQHKGCSKNLASQNKSGYCQYHWNFHNKDIEYRDAHNHDPEHKKQVKAYHLALKVLRKNHLAEFNVIYSGVKNEKN